MRTPEIRAGDATDLPDVMAIMRSAFDPRYGEAWTESQCLGVMAMSGSRLLIATEGRACGFALMRTALDETELMLLAVAPWAQRRGTGRVLLDHVIADAALAGARSIFLEMRASNDAVNLYASRGFVEIGLRRAYYRGADGAAHDALTYRRMLI